jgi:hypothetical protein
MGHEATEQSSTNATYAFDEFKPPHQSIASVRIFKPKYLKVLRASIVASDHSPSS